ncbi:MAG: hypothetical protein J6B28_09310 [Eubacterium sp.]|nr:hypothetical protein [Eubacterium sp.]
MIEEYLINEENCHVFSGCIPQMLADEIVAGELIGIGAYDTWEEEVVGVILMRDVENWLELVWICFSDNYIDSEDAYQMLYKRLRRVKKAGKLQGAFIDFVDDEKEQELAWIFDLIGFRTLKGVDDIWHLKIGDLKNNELLHRKCDRYVHSLQSMDADTRKKIQKSIRLEARAMPLPQTLNWSNYDEEISVVYVENKKPIGMLLFQWMEEEIYFSFAWSNDPKILVMMLAAALQTAEEKASEDTIICIPILDSPLAKLIKKIVPQAQCGELTRREIRFSDLA